MTKNTSVLSTKRIPPIYIMKMIYRNIIDVFRPMRKLESEPLVIDPKEVRVWVIGHATTLINLFGTTILTDPVLINAFPLPKRLIAHGYSAEQLPPLDYVVVSHAHLDHCDTRSLRKLAAKTKTIIVPRNCADIVKNMGFGKVVELDWENTFTENGMQATAYRPKHWGRRFPWELRNRGFNCYTFEKNNRTVFFGGDTGYGDFFKRIGQKHTIDIALLPISAYDPVTPHHMNPVEAHQAFEDLKSAHCIPIHWGSFRLALEPMNDPPELFVKHAIVRGVETRSHLLENGKSFTLIFDEAAEAFTLKTDTPELIAP